MKKKILALMMAAALVVSMTACSSGSDSSDAEETTSEETASDETSEAADESEESEEASASFTTVTDGVLTVATSPDFAPYEFYAIDDDGNVTLAGFDVALAGYIADYLGLELEMVTVDFDGVLSELQTGSVDLGMAGLSPSEEREEIMDFTDIYYTSAQALVTVSDKADQITSLEDVNSSDITVAAQTGSIQIGLMEEYSPEADQISLPKVTDIITELLTGKIDAAYVEMAVAESYQSNYEELVIVCEVPYDTEGAAVGVNKNDDGLLEAVNEAINAALEDGSFDDFVAEANELASGDTYEGLLDEEGNTQ